MLSERKWKLESVLRLGLGIFLSLSIGVLVVGLLRGSADPKPAFSVGRVLISALAFQGAILAFTWRFLREQGLTWIAGFGFARKTWQSIGLGAGMVGLFVPLGWGLQKLSITLMHRAGFEPSEQLALTALRNSGTAAQILAMGFVTILLAPVAEEILFRGVLYPAVKQFGFPRTALWGTSTLFALIHFNLASFLPLLALALLLIWLYERTDNLLAPIAAHVTFNSINFILFFAAQDFARKLPPQS